MGSSGPEIASSESAVRVPPDDPSLLFSPLDSFDPVLVADALEDHALRRKARPLHPLDWTAVVNEKGHPAYPAVCDVCGTLSMVLNHCGRPLCIPCQRKRVSRNAPIVMDATLRVQAWLEEQNRAHNKRWRLRFITLTLRNVPFGMLASTVNRIQRAYQALRRRRFWRDCDVQGDFPRVEWTLTSTGWHIHLHVFVAGGFVPAGPDVARPGESNLRDEWLALTGDSMVVKIESVDSARDAVPELVKYLFKPTDDLGESIAGWPEEARKEMAAVVAGPYRTAWYCRPHRSRFRARCLERWVDTPVGFQPVVCEGEYRLERQGFRPLLPTGIFRSMLTRAKYEREARPSDCPSCGLGKLHARAYWLGRARDCGQGDCWASSALNLIQEHEMTSDYPRPRLNLLAEMPSGWIPPPPYEDFRPEVRVVIVDMLRRTPRGLDNLLDLMSVPPEHEHAIELALLSLERLGIVHRERSGAYCLNGPLLKRLTEVEP